MKPPITLFIPGFLWFVLTFILLTLPGKDIPDIQFLDGVYFDKWVHVGLFALLTFLFSFPYKKYLQQKNIYILIAVCAFIYGVLMEFVQKFFVTNRSFDTTDMIADGIGCLLAYLFIQFQLRRRLKASNK